MRLTRASSRALLQQQRGSPSDTNRLPNITTIDKLPDEILLEIFDSYRRGFGPQHNHENAWNGKNGWFKLAHVCQNWRRIVLASPSSLHLLLIFTPRSPQRAAMLTRLPPLPVFINYGAGAQNVREENRVLSALKYSNRVRGIDFRPSESRIAPEMLLKVLNYPLPELESLEFDLLADVRARFPTTFIQGSAQRLRHLKLWGAQLSSLSQLLSSTTGLIDLSLGIDTLSCPSPPVSLLTLLQGMLALRRLELRMWYTRHGVIDVPTPSTKTEDIVRLSHLTYFQFSGYTADLEGLVARLATPSLQDFRVDFYDCCSPFSMPVPHLSRFIHDMDRPVFAAKFEFGTHDLHISMSHSLPDLTSKIILPWGIPLAQISSMFPAALATVQDLLITISRSFRDPTEYHKFLEQFHNVKILRLRPGLVSDIMGSLQLDDGEPALDVLPALEEIDLVGEDQHAHTFGNLGPFVAARQRAGRPVKVFWNTQQVLPEHFCGTSD
ncbi:hypothetical protein BJV78DRAFT_474326 [Lactifluus subvellereus]|nr:hypothetical protein BJV78DRAFT_474326 [Lactifluus subvellereus]